MAPPTRSRRLWRRSVEELSVRSLPRSSRVRVARLPEKIGTLVDPRDDKRLPIVSPSDVLPSLALAGLRSICEANGMTEEHLTRRGADKVQHVEMFLFNYPRVRGLSLFVNLSSLSIMQQQLTRIEGLDACVNLERNWGEGRL